MLRHTRVYARVIRPTEMQVAPPPAAMMLAQQHRHLGADTRVHHAVLLPGEGQEPTTNG